MADERYKIQRHKGEEIETLLDKLQTLVGSVNVDKTLTDMIAATAMVTDNAVTANSSNPVKSSGIAAYVSSMIVAAIENLLRGDNTYSGSNAHYEEDTWSDGHSTNSPSTTVNYGGVTVGNPSSLAVGDQSARVLPQSVIVRNEGYNILSSTITTKETEVTPEKVIISIETKPRGSSTTDKTTAEINLEKIRKLDALITFLEKLQTLLGNVEVDSSLTNMLDATKDGILEGDNLYTGSNQHNGEDTWLNNGSQDGQPHAFIDSTHMGILGPDIRYVQKGAVLGEENLTVEYVSTDIFNVRTVKRIVVSSDAITFSVGSDSATIDLQKVKNLDTLIEALLNTRYPNNIVEKLQTLIGSISITKSLTEMIAEGGGGGTTVTIDDTVSSGSANPVKSSGISSFVSQAIANERIDLSNLILSGSQEGVTLEDLHNAHKLWFVTGGNYSDVFMYNNLLYYDVYEWGRELKRVFKQISMQNGVMTVVDTTEVTLNN